jgi:hypothetical protein
MISLIIRRLTYTLASLAASLLLTSCVIPILGSEFVDAMRDNVGERVPDFIIPGVTTMEDVLMHLGEADSSVGDIGLLVGGKFVLSYHSGVPRGGALVFLPAGTGGIGYGYSRELQRILIVEFGESGLVKSARLETKSCSVHSTATARWYGSGRSCVPVGEPTVLGDAPKAASPEPEP